jgi:hypothetical protein
MINRIGVLCQDRISFGFLLGIKRRLQCDAELVEPSTGGIAKSTTMTRRQAKLALADLRHRGADLIVRFTDSDRNRWQEIARNEERVFVDAGSTFVCGVAVNNVEEWLALDQSYLASVLSVDVRSLEVESQRTDIIKGALKRMRNPDQPQSEVSAQIVQQAPPEVFRSWLRSDDSLRRFYQTCRAAALRDSCDVPNELDDER